MGFVLHMSEAGRSIALTRMYAVLEVERGLGVVGESLLHQNAQGELQPSDQCVSPALIFCRDIIQGLDYPESTMRDAFRMAHEPIPARTKDRIRRGAIGAAALAVNGSLKWGVIGGGGVAIIGKKDAGVVFITADEHEQQGDIITQAEMHKQRWDNPKEFASINGDPRMIGREHVGSRDINPSQDKVVVFSEQARPLLDDEAMRMLLLRAAAGMESQASVREHITQGRSAHRFPDGAMSLIVLEAVNRQRQPQQYRGYTGNSRQLLGWDVQRALQMRADEAE